MEGESLTDEIARFDAAAARLFPRLAPVPQIAEATFDPRKSWRIEFDDGTGMGGITRREAMRTARHELKQGRRVTIIPPSAA